MWAKIALVALALVYAFDITKGAIKGKGKYVLKKRINSLGRLLGFVWVMFFLIGATYLTVPIRNWTQAQVGEWGAETSTGFVLSWAPYIWIITTFYICGKALSLSCKPIWHYTDEEEKNNKIERERTRKSLNKVLSFFHLRTLREE